MSIINHEYGHVFIHNPKTAGSSMERQEWIGGNAHRTAAVLVPMAPPAFFSWGFVRHPCDRLLSFYSAAIQHRPAWPEVEAAGGFEPFVMELGDSPRKRPRRNGTIPQTTILCREDGSIAVDFVGRFETLQRDWRIVCERIVPDREDTEPLPHVNASRHAPWRDVYTPAMIDVVRWVYADDFRVFGYD